MTEATQIEAYIELLQQHYANVSEQYRTECVIARTKLPEPHSMALFQAFLHYDLGIFSANQTIARMREIFELPTPVVPSSLVLGQLSKVLHGKLACTSIDAGV